MKRLGMNIMRGSLLLASALLVFACGRNDTVASKSAAANREAQAKGTPAGGGHDHGAHHAPAATGGTAEVDHSAHGAAADPHAGHDMTSGGTANHAAHGSMSAADHAAMGHGTAGGAHAGHTSGRGGATDHAAHGGATDHAAHGRATDHAAHGRATDHAAHRGVAAGDHAQHGTASRASAGHASHAAPAGAAAHEQHAGMQHGTSPSADAHAQHQQPGPAPAHAGHGAAQPATAAPALVLGAPTSSAEMARVRPAATLQPDAFDAPAPIAVAEAKKAAGGAASQTGTATDPHAGHGSTGGASRQTVYTCPMHPEVTSAAPGTCPKCGMSLVKKE